MKLHIGSCVWIWALMPLSPLLSQLSLGACCLTLGLWGLIELPSWRWDEQPMEYHDAEGWWTGRACWHPWEIEKHLNNADQKATGGHCQQELDEGAQLQSWALLGCPVQEVGLIGEPRAVKQSWGREWSSSAVRKCWELGRFRRILSVCVKMGLEAVKELELGSSWCPGQDKEQWNAGNKCYRLLWSEGGQMLPWSPQR